MTAVNANAGEARQALHYAPLALLAAVLLVVSALIKLGGVHTSINEETIGLITESKRGSVDIIGAILNAIGLVLSAATLNFLFLAVRRRQAAIGAYIRVLAILGGTLAGVLGIVYWIIVRQKSHEFVDHGSQTWVQANQLTKGAAFTVIPTVELAAALALAVAFVLISLGAMRVGLLTRFMGYLGMLVGALVLFPIGSPVPVVQAFWLVAVAALLSGRWPSGMPPAWASGTAIPWPSSAQLREDRVRAAAGRTARAEPDGRRRGARDAKPPAPAAGPSQPAAPAQPRVSQKRKRKKRR